MLQRSARLPSRTRLQQFQLYNTPYFILKVADNSLQNSRFGFVISKRTAKTAVDRNTSKRKLRTGIEKIKDRIRPGYDFLFMLTKNLAEEQTNTVQTAVKSTLEEKGYLV